jgi:peptidylprolyl isomerase
MTAASTNKKKRKISFLAIFIILAILIVSITLMVNLKNRITQVRLETTEGNITINLYKDMPITAGNFEKLVKEEFYDGTIFHRVIPGFMIQGGDPTGTGAGGPGYTIKDEFTHEGGNKNNRGTISMANAGPNTGGSQFFINLVNNNFLDSKHPVFGKVIEGMDVVDKIAKIPTNSNDKPLKEVKIIKATILK